MKNSDGHPFKYYIVLQSKYCESFIVLYVVVFPPLDGEVSRCTHHAVKILPRLLNITEDYCVMHIAKDAAIKIKLKRLLDTYVNQVEWGTLHLEKKRTGKLNELRWTTGR